MGTGLDFFSIIMAKAGHKVTAIDCTDAMLNYRKSMPMCQKTRPQWDLDTLVARGYSELTCLTNINERVYDEKRKFLYRSTPMFMIAATKP
ncbi:hypothetical protein [Proteus alimentorum]|uniref:hypothetical protein n=1 Tax=Proteus alimentorum TaxID=1973495 RepID=UPI00197E6C86|nr:hypothetical protein [Proteus alimentorum]